MQIITISEFRALEESRDVKEIVNNGISGDGYHRWYTVTYVDGVEKNVYMKPNEFEEVMTID
jgi:hypothetical protein